MSIVVVGLNHKTAPIEFREKFAFSSEEVERVLVSLTAHSLLKEAVIISTCNRVEIYTYGISEKVVAEWLCEFSSFKSAQTITADDFLQHGYALSGIEAVEHLMRVACGLDSLVLGEPEILGQVKAGFSMACLHKTVGSQLSLLFRQVFHLAKCVRTTTKIGACPVSVASTAVMFAREWSQQKIERPRIVVIGSGAVGRLVAKHAQSLTSVPVVIVSRHFVNAERVAKEVHGVAGELAQLEKYLQQADIVISATASKTTIIQADMLQAVSHSMLLIDLAVPRDIAPDVSKKAQITLCQLDQLKATIQQHVHIRAHAASQAESLVEEYARDFMLSLRALNSDEIIKRYRETIEMYCNNELQKTLKENRSGEITASVLHDFSRNLMNKIMHVPSVQLRQASMEGRHDLLASASEIFGVKGNVKQ